MYYSSFNNPNDNEENIKYSKNNYSGTTIFLIIAGICLLIVSCYIIFINVFTKDNKVTDYTDDNDKIKITNNEVKNLVNKYLLEDKTGYVFTNGLDDLYKIYVTSKTINDGYITTVSCNDAYDKEQLQQGASFNYYSGKYGSCQENEKYKAIKYDDFSKHYKDLFDVVAPKEGGYNSSTRYFGYYFLDYSEKVDMFIFTKCLSGCGGASGPHITFNEYKDFEIKDDTLTINIYYDDLVPGKGGYFEINGTSIGISYKEDNYSDKAIQIIKDEFLEDATLYKATFKKVNDRFILTGVSK